MSGLSLRRILAVNSKELRQLTRDRLTLAMIGLMPLMMILIFGYGINLDVRHVRAGVVDLAATSGSRAFIAELEATQVVHVVAWPRGVAALRQAIAAGEIGAGLYIPRDFERRLIDGERPAAQLFVDGSEPGIAAVVGALASAPFPVRSGLGFGEHTGEARRSAAPVLTSLELRTEFNPEHRTAVQIVPALIGVILNMTMVVFTAIALVRERERGNLELLITTPLRPLELMIGKLLPYVLVGLIQTTLILLVGVLLFNVPVNGSVAQLYLGALLFIAATLGMGLLISTAAQTQFQAMQMGFFTMLPSILLSGFMFPFDGMPYLVQLLAQLLPLTHFVQILRGVVLRGAGLGALGWPLTKLTLFLVIAVTIAASRFRKQLD
ncbi:MAG TPA: ABC transporter permease [Steroidobacteraceae bacterium]